MEFELQKFNRIITAEERLVLCFCELPRWEAGRGRGGRYGETSLYSALKVKTESNYWSVFNKTVWYKNTVGKYLWL